MQEKIFFTAKCRHLLAMNAVKAVKFCNFYCKVPASFSDECGESGEILQFLLQSARIF